VAGIFLGWRDQAITLTTSPFGTPITSQIKKLSLTSLSPASIDEHAAQAKTKYRSIECCGEKDAG
jgi:hypothetical protein